MEWGKIQHTSIDLLRNVSMRVLYFALSGGRREKKKSKLQRLPVKQVQAEHLYKLHKVANMFVGLHCMILPSAIQ